MEISALIVLASGATDSHTFVLHLAAAIRAEAGQAAHDQFVDAFGMHHLVGNNPRTLADKYPCLPLLARAEAWKAQAAAEVRE